MCRDGALPLATVPLRYACVTGYRVEPLGVLVQCPNAKIKTDIKSVLIFGGRMGTRTPDPLIKSQLLYQLSYAPVDHLTR